MQVKSSQVAFNNNECDKRTIVQKIQYMVQYNVQ